MFGDAMARAFPERARTRSGSTAPRRSAPRSRRAVPLYAGIETLRAKGDQVQWGGRTLYADGRFATAGRQGAFLAGSTRAARPRRRADARRDFVPFRVSTRRGKQFNSMVQRDVDPLTGARRDDVLISAEDLRRWSSTNGARGPSAIGERHVSTAACKAGADQAG